MANPFVLCSLTAFAAIAAPSGSRLSSWFRGLFGRANSYNSAPVVTTDEGWTLIRCEDAAAFAEWLGADETGLPFRPDEEPSLGSHLLVELFGCDSDSLKHEDGVGGAMEEAARKSEATVVAQSFHEFKPYGVSGAVIIQESHYTIHTWPEHGYAAVDLFYCGGGIAVHKAVEVLQDRFKPKRIKFLVVRRGLQSEVER